MTSPVLFRQRVILLIISFCRRVERTRRLTAFGRQTEFAKAFADPHDVVIAAAKALVGIVVGSAGTVERCAHSLERRGERDQLLVKLCTTGDYLCRITALGIAFPKVVDQFQQREKVCG